jgi:hypothetical protein
LKADAAAIAWRLGHPVGVVRDAHAATGITVTIFIEEDMVAKMHIVLYPEILREHRALSVSIPEKYPGLAVGDFLSGTDRSMLSS